MSKIGVGIIGTGNISAYHMDALNRIPFTEIKVIYDVDSNVANEKAKKFNIPKISNNVDEILADPNIVAVHNCTPNFLHAEITEKIIKAGKHIFTEKPLAINSIESKKLLELLKNYPDTVAGVNFNYRMNALVQEMKLKMKNGEIGKPILAFGSYLQDTALLDTRYSWFLEKDKVGPSFAIANIGTHWMDLVQFILDDKITDVCADLVTVHKIRKKATPPIDPFNYEESVKRATFEEKKIDLDDYGAVLFKMKGGVHGVFYVSHVSAGRKCYFNIEIDGTEASMYWNVENADQMWMGYRNKQNLQIFRNMFLMPPEIRFTYNTLPPGHTEGWNDAMKNNLSSFYRFILDGKKLGKDKPDFGTFEDGHYIVKLVETILESSKNGSWQKIE